MANAEQRRADAAKRAAMAAADARAEAASAQRLIDAFVAELGSRGIPPEPLHARMLDGTRVKCDRVGWYLNAARTIAIGPGGEYFQLTVPGRPFARVRGVCVPAGQPSLVVARGGRDGEGGDLAGLLARALAAYSES